VGWLGSRRRALNRQLEYLVQVTMGMLETRKPKTKAAEEVRRRSLDDC